jgi:phosphotransferase system enzyme I (PtsI)
MAALRDVTGREVTGQAASGGIARGPAHVAVDPARQFAPQVSVALERQALGEAVRVAIAELEALMGRSDPESAEILEFQIEMLLDAELIELALARVAAGDSAALAWAGGLDDYIAEIETSGDAIFSARAADVADIRSRVLAVLTGTPVGDFPEGAVFVAKDIAPSRFLAHDWSGGGGIALTGGSAVSHVASLARAKSVPMVVGLGGLAAADGDTILLDGTRGCAVVNPPVGAAGHEPIAANAGTGDIAKGTAPAAAGVLRTADGVPVGLWLNVNDAADFERIDPASVDGVGLVRTEFLLSTPADVVDEERQYGLYRRLTDWSGARPVTIRMLDLGGDKPMPGLGGAEDTSFLGVRGTRFLLSRPEIARTQARAILRAAVAGNVRVMLPMVTVPSELAAMRQIFADEAALLARRGISHVLPPVGIMVEVPAAALTLDQFSAAAFFSFGTNDLAQYLAAAARDNPIVAPLHGEAALALFRLLENAVAMAGRVQIPVSVCGDMAGDPTFVPNLLACGFRDFSMAPPRLADVRSAIARLCADGRPAAGE